MQPLTDEPDNPGRWSFLPYLLLLAAFCIPLGWLQRQVIHYWKGDETALLFAPLLLFLPLAFSSKVRGKYSAFGSFSLALALTVIGYLNPVWLPDDEYVLPMYGSSEPSVTVNGVDPRSFKQEGTACLRSSAKLESLKEAESVVYKYGYYAKVYLALASETVVDLQIHLLHPNHDSVSKERAENLLSGFGSSPAQPSSRSQVEQKLSLLFSDPLPEPISGKAYLADYQDGSRVVIHHGGELAVFGNSLYQKNNLITRTGQAFVQPKVDHWEATSNYDADYHYRYLEFQMQTIDDSHLYVQLLDDRSAMKRAWAVFPLPMDFDYRGEKGVLEAYQQSP